MIDMYLQLGIESTLGSTPQPGATSAKEALAAAGESGGGIENACV